MKTEDPKALGQILSKEKPLQLLLQRIEHLRRCQQVLMTVLPSDLGNHCQVINFQPPALIIGVDSATWLTHIKHNQPQLVQKLRQHGLNIEYVHYKVVPHSHAIPSTPRRSKPTLGRQAQHNIQQMLQFLPEGKLKAAWQKLSQRGDSNEK